MVSKNNRKLIAEKNRKNEKQRFALRKLNVGVASVLLGITFSVYGGGQLVAHADTTGTSDQPEEAKATSNETLADQSQVTLNNNQPQATTSENSSQSATQVQPAGNQGGAAGKASAAGTSTTGQQGASAANDQTVNAQQQARSNTSNATNLVALAASTATAEDSNSVTVTDANGLIDALQNGTATTINVAGDINLGSVTDAVYTEINIKNKRNIVIKSATAGVKYTIDFAGYSFDMNTQNSVTFKDLNLYDRSYWGIIYNAGGYVFDNVDFTGSQLVYTKPSINSTVTFKNNVNATAVGSYVGPLDGKTRTSQGGNTQQILQFEGGNNQIIFASGSTVTLTTANSNVLEIDGGTTTIDVQNGANVTIDPHSKGNPETLNSIGTGVIARAIASKGTTNLNIDKGATLNINLVKDASDKDLSGALYLNSGATLNVNGNLNINSAGQSNYSRPDYVPVYINGTAAINVNGGSFKVNATNMGTNYTGPIISSNGKSTIAISHHGTFDVTGDGAKATAIALGSGSTFTSAQPELFNISMPDGATAIQNGKVQFTGVKTSATGQPIGEIDISYDKNGTPTVTKVTSYDEATATATRTAGNAAKNKISLIAAGEEVNLTNVKFAKNADGTYTMSGNANTADQQGAYVYITVNNQVHQVATTDTQTLWTVGQTGDPTASSEPYSVQTGTDGSFSVNLGQLSAGDQVGIYAAKDFVKSDTQGPKSVNEWMAASYKTELKDLVDEAPTIEKSSNYTAAGSAEQTSYTDAISGGQAVLDNQAASSDQIQAAIQAITAAKKGLNGDLNTAKQALQDAVDAQAATQQTAAYYNADTTKQQAYDGAITAGKAALAVQNPTVASLTAALAAINTAKGALDGQATDKSALQKSVDGAVDPASVNADAQVKADYTAALANAKATLADAKATQAAVDAANTALTNAQAALATSELQTAKQALQDAVDAQTATQQTAAYYNADTTKQQAYDGAITAGKAALAAQDPTVASLTAALAAINTAKSALDGQATDTSKLEAAVNNAATIEAGNDYKNASADVQKQYTDAVAAGQALLNQTTPAPTQAAVDAAAKAITDAQAALATSAAANIEHSQRTARASLNSALSAAIQAIDADTNLTETQRNDYKEQARQAASVAAANIGAATTQNDVTAALTAGKVNIDKAVANAAIDNAAAGKKAEISNATGLSSDHAAALNSDVDAAVTAAKQAITAATTQDGVAAAQTDGVNKINAIDVTTVANQDKSTAAIDQAAQTAKQAIENNQDLTDEQKQAATAQVDQAATAAKNNIKNAQNDQDINSATAAGQLAIAKAAAKAAVQGALNKKLGEINNATALTTEEKAALTTQANTAATNANTAIDAATTPADVTTAETAGVNGIENVQVPTESAAKTAAKQAVAAAAEAKNQAIDSANLTTEEKAALKQEVSAAQTAADNAIDAATTNTAVTAAQTSGVENINKIVIPTSSAVKTKATTDLNTAVDNAKQAIDQDTNLTPEQKQAAKDQIEADAKTAQEAINAAQSDADVTTAADSGKLAIAKDVANAAIDNAVAGKKSEIAQSTLTTEEKNKLNDEVAKAAATAKQEIAAATTEDGVTGAGTKGVAQIEGINVPTASAVKNNAIAAIDQALQKKTDEINSATNLTSQEKQQLANQANEAASQAKNNIKQATTDAAVATAQTNGEKAIADVTVPGLADIQRESIDLINRALDEKKTAINNADNLSQAEKQQLINTVTQAATAAINEVNAAKTNDAAKHAADIGVKVVEGVMIPSLADAKTAANQVIAATLAAKTAEINAATNLSAAEKTDLVTKANAAADTAKANIASATTNDAVKNAENDGVNNIKGVTFTSLADAKAAANQAIDAAKEAKMAEINAATHLSTAEKNGLISQAMVAAGEAHSRIDQATTNDAVAEAQNKGIQAIASVIVPSLAEIKQDAINEIKQVQEAKNKQINAATNLSTTEQQQLIDQVAAIANDAIAKINDPATTTLDAADEISNNAIDQITNLLIPTLGDAQNNATNAINAAKDAKLAEIDQADNLSAKEKQALADQVNQAAADATKAIKDASTNDAVKAAESKGLDAINAVVVPSLAKAQQAAKEAVAQAAAAKNQTIDNSNLTAEEKAALKQEVSAAQTAANQAIDKATTNDGVSQAQAEGIDNINAIVIPSSSTAKTKATADLNNAVADAKQAIDQDTNLTPDQKQAAKEQIDQDAKQAQEIIDQATTDGAVKNAVANGQLTIAKDVAKAAIDNAAAGKKAAINAAGLTDAQKAALNSEVDSLAQQAKNAINQALTDSAVTTALNNGIAAIDAVVIPASENGAGDTQNGAAAGATTGAAQSAGQLAGAQLPGQGNTANRKATLPQTGNDTNRLAIAGLAAASLLGLFGLGKRDRKKN